MELPDPRSRHILVMMRVTASENRKHRPEWYSKETCIRSVLDAAHVLREAGGTVTLVALTDTTGGPVSPAVDELLRDFDRVAPIVGGSARRSWKAMFDVLKRDYRDNPFDILYLVEDDHLHHPDALTALTWFEGDFGLLYTRRFDPTREVVRWGPHEWHHAVLGVSSFACSREAFAKSRRLLRTMSNTNHAWDEVTWTTLRGPRYFGLRYLTWSFSADSPWAPWRPEAIWQALWRTIGFVWSLCRRPSRVQAVRPNLATHAETAFLSDGRDWAAIAEQAGRVR